MKPPKGYEECDSCNPCNPDCDETGRPYTCYRCCDTGFMLADQHYFEYLDELRDSGVTNMFGAGIYLETEFGVDRYEAKRILLAWMVSCEGVNHA